MSEMDEFLKISKYAGSRQDLVQAGGGNSSVKIDDGKMYIKASGYQLADLKNTAGYAIVDYKKISEYFNCTPTESILDEIESKLIESTFLQGERPSIEVFLHSVTDLVTLHTHPTVVNVLTARRGGMEVLKTLFPEALFVDYATPGIKLAKMYHTACAALSNKNVALPAIIFLKNHGMIVNGKTAEIVMNKTEEAIEVIAKYLGMNVQAYQNSTVLSGFLVKKYAEHIVWTVDDSYVRERFTYTGGQMWDYQFCPDCIVYCGKAPLILNENDIETQIARHMELNGKPVVISFRNHLYIHAQSVRKALEIQTVLSFSAQVTKHNEGYEMDLLSDQEQRFLLNWESEKFRQNL